MKDLNFLPDESLDEVVGGQSGYRRRGSGYRRGSRRYYSYYPRYGSYYRRGSRRRRGSYYY